MGKSPVGIYLRRLEEKRCIIISRVIRPTAFKVQEA